MAKKKTTKRGRDARTGRFITVREAMRRKATAVVDSIPVRRKKRKKKKKKS
ncbi:MAG TPA: hypothetical protein VF587_16690 [Solirubrobacteraceae bacterium]